MYWPPQKKRRLEWSYAYFPVREENIGNAHVPRYCIPLSVAQ